MRLRPNLHDLYIGKAVLGTVVLVWAVVIGLDVTLAVLSELNDIGKGNYGFSQALAYVAYTVPRRAYTLFPTAAVVGALMGLGQLAANSELTALRALGLSRMRLTLSVMMALAVVTGLLTINAETLSAWGMNQSSVLRSTARNGNVAMARYSGLWAREGDTFLNAEAGDEVTVNGQTTLQLRGVRLYRIGPEGRLASITHAALAQHRDNGWLLKDVSRTVFHQRSASREQVAEERWESKLDVASLSASIVRPDSMSLRDLARSIDYRHRNGLDAGVFEDEYWQRLFYAFNVLALCVAAIPFAFGSLRSGGLGKRIFIGMLFALGFWVVQTLFFRLAQAFKLDFRLAYVLPSVLMLMVSAWMFGRRRRRAAA
jgi:lipopolysaccharide export system permease protein